MAVVYKAEHVHMGTAAAIKVLASNLARNEKVQTRFTAEASVMAHLRHPNIVTVHDFVVERELLAIVMEFLDGPTLADLLRARQAPMTPSEALPLFRQILEAVGFAHGNGVVHRDLKPSNVMIVQMGAKQVAKVLDFGLVKILGKGPQLTGTGAKMGTLWYMSPEQCQSAKDAGPATDIYALGVTLFQMVTAKVPFDGESDYEIMKGHIELEPPAPSSFVSGLPSELEQVVMKALAKDPAQRWESCGEFLAALDEGAGRVRGAERGRAGSVDATGGHTDPYLPQKQRATPPARYVQPPQTGPPSTAPEPIGTNTADATNHQTGLEAHAGLQAPLLGAGQRSVGTKTQARRRWLLAVTAVFAVALVAVLVELVGSQQGDPVDESERSLTEEEVLGEETQHDPGVGTAVVAPPVDSLPAIQAAESFEPLDSWAVIQAAESLMSEGRWADAIEVLTEIDTNDPNYGYREELMIRARNERRVQDDYERIIQLEQSGEYEAALALIGDIPSGSYYANYLRENGAEQRIREAWLEQALADAEEYAEVGRFDDARETLEPLEDVFPGNARIASLNDDIDNAEEEAEEDVAVVVVEEEVEEEEPRLEEARRQQEEEVEEEEEQLSEEEREAAVEDQMRNAGRMGVRGDYAAAVDALEAALDLGARDADIYLMLYQNHAQLGNDPDAADALEEYIERRPNARNVNDLRELLEELRR